MATKNKCRFWGENRADEYYFDVGCVIGHADCKAKECKDYQEP
jgi:hypothetical protein